MLKKIVSALLLCILVSSFISVLADSISLPPDETFAAAKEALRLMGEKKYDQAIDTLNANNWLSRNELKCIIDSSCKRLYQMSVQQEYAIAWIDKGALYMAVPVEDPTDGYVDTLLLTLNAQYEFTSCSFVRWTEIENALSKSAQTKWCDEYVPAYKVFVD